MKIPASIQRYPLRKKELLQAWDSADTLLIEHVAQLSLHAAARILIVGDQFGALAAALQHLQPTVYTDSYLSSEAIRLNTLPSIHLISDLEDLSGIYDLALIRIPKNMAFLEDILCHLSQHLNAESQLIFGYQIKHQAASSFSLIEKRIGTTHTSLAQKKARLIFAKLQHQPCPSPYPSATPIEGFASPLVRHSNLFSREKLDIGTRFFLAHIPKGISGTLLDLGCGDGLLGIAAQLKNPNSTVYFSDESKMAIESAKINYSTYFKNSQCPVPKFFWTHGFENQPAQSIQTILCNPPFHQGHAVGETIAHDMFHHAHSALIFAGTLRIIGNQHLMYDRILKKIFGNCTQIAKNQKFVILEATRTSR